MCERKLAGNEAMIDSSITQLYNGSLEPRPSTQFFHSRGKNRGCEKKLRGRPGFEASIMAGVQLPCVIYILHQPTVIPLAVVLQKR